MLGDSSRRLGPYHFVVLTRYLFMGASLGVPGGLWVPIDRSWCDVRVTMVNMRGVGICGCFIKSVDPRVSIRASLRISAMVDCACPLTPSKSRTAVSKIFMMAFV